MPFDIKAAREAGFSDGEISEFLAQQNGKFDVESARKSGYSDNEIIEYLTESMTNAPPQAAPAAQQPEPPPSVGEDVAKSVALSGLPKGGIGFLSLPAEIGNLAVKGMAYGVKNLANLTPEQEARLDQVRPFYGYPEAKSAVEGVTGDLYTPKTTAGRYASTATEYAVGSPAKFIPASLAGGLAAEAAGDATGNDPAMKALAGMLVTGGAVTVQGLRGSAGRATRDALEPVTKEQLEMADALVKRSYESGAPVTGAEAIAKVTNNPNSKLLALQRVTEDSTKGGPKLQSFMSQRPAGNERMVADAVGGVSPVQAYGDIPDRARKAAEGVMSDVRKQGNDLARPYYDATTNAKVKVSPTAWDFANQDSRIAAALQEAKKNPYYGIPDTEPQGSLRWMDAAQKILKDKADAFANSGENYASKLAGEARSNLLEITDRSFPNYGKAREIVKKNAETNLRPLELSPVGKIAAVNADTEGALTRQFRSLIGSDNATPKEIGAAVARLSTKDEQAARDLMAAGLANEFKAKAESLASGSPMYGQQFAGSKWAASVDTPEIKAAVEALPQGKDAYKGLGNAFEILKAQGMRRPAYNSADAKQALKGGNVASAMRNLPGVLGVAYENFRYGKDTRILSDLLTSPESVNDLVKLGKLDPQSAAARRLLATMLVGNKAANSTE